MTGIMIMMDFILATLPVQLIRNLQRPLREKILISCLMAMGLLATSIAAYKIPLSREVNNGDPLSATVKLALWNKLEEQLGLIAACLPCLKAQMEDLLHRLGILKSRIGHWPAFSTNVKKSFSSSPSQSPHDTDEPNSEGTNRHSSDAGLVSFATNTMGTGGTIFTFKSQTEKSEARELGSRDWDV
jgi:Fungal rhodopsin domain